MKSRMKKEKALTGVIMLALTMGFMPAAQAGSASSFQWWAGHLFRVFL